MRISLSSLNQYWEDKEKNFNLCLSKIKKASSQNSDLIIFPEMTLTGFSNNISALADDNSSVVNLFSEVARKNNIAIIFGAIIKNNSQKASNKAFFVDNNGSLICEYKKIHPFSMAMENNFYESGNEIKAVQYKDLRIGLTICYDLRFPEIYSSLAKECDLILNIANWPKKRVDHWRTLLKSRAIENQLFIAGINRTGVDGNGLEYEESSMVYDANGNEVEYNETEKNLKTFSINKMFTQEFKQRFNSFKDRKTELYKSIL